MGGFSPSFSSSSPTFPHAYSDTSSPFSPTSAIFADKKGLYSDIKSLYPHIFSDIRSGEDVSVDPLRWMGGAIACLAELVEEHPAVDVFDEDESRRLPGFVK